MEHLLNLLAAIALLVWGTQITRTGILRVFVERLQHAIGLGVSSRPTALATGIGVTMLVQSSTATCLIVAPFVGKGLMSTAAALAVILGADIGTSLMAVVFSFDLSWLSPLAIFAGVVLYVTREQTTAGRLGQVAIGVGLITLALQLIVAATQPLVQSPAVRALLIALPSEPLLDMLVGALLTLLSYSSLAIVLLTAALASQGLLPTPEALGLVLGANLGSGLLGLLTTARSNIATRRLPLGNLLFKLVGCLIAVPLLPRALAVLRDAVPEITQQVVLFHLAFNAVLALLFIGATGFVARALERWWVAPPAPPGTARPQHLDPMALATPSLAISSAAR